MEAILLVGIQASGKSTFYRQRFVDTHIRINLDMLRTRHREQIILRACLEAKQPFVVDNTNTTAIDRARYIVPAKEAGFRIVGYYFRSNLGDLLRRNRQREAHKIVPDKAIFGAHRQLQVPAFEEGFDALYSVTSSGANEFEVQVIAAGG
jgi:predicted kinase